MMEWDSRMKNNHCVKVLKAAIPFLDVQVGETIDMEGLLQALQPFAVDSERKAIDIILQFFQMRRMFEMMSVLKTMMPQEEDGMAESVMQMFSMMQSPPKEQENGDENEQPDI